MWLFTYVGAVFNGITILILGEQGSCATFTHQRTGLDEPGTVRESGLIGSLTPTELVFRPSKGSY